MYYNVAEKHKPTPILVKVMNKLEWTHQFVFGLILVGAWLIFLIVPLLFFKNLTIDQYLIAVERISAIFAVALGFVWGYYFGQKSSEQTVKMLKERADKLDGQVDELRGFSRRTSGGGVEEL